MQMRTVVAQLSNSSPSTAKYAMGAKLRHKMPPSKSGPVILANWEYKGYNYVAIGWIPTKYGYSELSHKT